MIQVTSSGTGKLETWLLYLFVGTRLTHLSLFGNAIFLIITRENYWESLAGNGREYLLVAFSIREVGGFNLYHSYRLNLPIVRFFRSKK
jgi:hypothetical protein